MLYLGIDIRRDESNADTEDRGHGLDFLGFTAEEMYYKPNQLPELSSEIPIAQSSSDDHKSLLTLVSIIEILRHSFPVI